MAPALARMSKPGEQLKTREQLKQINGFPLKMAPTIAGMWPWQCYL